MRFRGVRWRPYSPALLAALLASLPLFAPGPAAALPDDREQPIHITADRAVRDEKRGITTYSGNVHMRQGSMEVDADSLVIYHETEDANRIVARGAPARMRQQPEIDKGLVHAHAAVITYFRDQERVHLRSDARIERDDGTLVTGESIDYFIAKQLVRAESDRSDEDNQVVVVIPPSLHQQGEDAAEAQAPPQSPAPAAEPAPEPGPQAAPEPSAESAQGDDAVSGAAQGE